MILTLTRTDDEGEYDLELEVEYTQERYYPATGPTYSCAGEPACGGEIILTCAWDMDGKAVALTDDEIARLEQMIADKLEMM